VRARRRGGEARGERVGECDARRVKVEHARDGAARGGDGALLLASKEYDFPLSATPRQSALTEFFARKFQRGVI